MVLLFVIFISVSQEKIVHLAKTKINKRLTETLPALCQEQYSALRCSQQTNATQEEHNVITITLFSPTFGKTEVESRVNISRGRFNTLECVATVEGEQAFTLFSINGELPSHSYMHTSKALTQEDRGAAVDQSHVLLANRCNPLHVYTLRLSINATKPNDLCKTLYTYQINVSD